MHLAIPFALLMGPFAAAAPSFQHAQISVEVTHTDSQNQADALHSSGKPVMNYDGPGLSYLPFNFTLIASKATGSHKVELPFGFADLTLPDGLARGELGYDTEFALRNGKLINGNRALAWHVAKVFPPWTSLWSYDKGKTHFYLDFVAIPHLSEGEQYFLENPARPVTFGVPKIGPGEPVFIGPAQLPGVRVVLQIQAIGNDDINADLAEELL